MAQGDGLANAMATAPPSAYYALTLPTLHGRIYRLEYQSTVPDSHDGSAWNKAQPHKVGEGRPTTFIELLENYKVRRYRVRILEPPTFTSAPHEREVQRVEGEPLRLAYSAKGAADDAHGLQWTWEHWPLDGEGPVALRNASPSLKIASVRPEDSGEYEVQVRNEAGCEAAPRVRLQVFRKPLIETLRWRIGDAAPIEETLFSGAPGGDPLGERSALTVEVRAGDSLRLEVDVAADTPTVVGWQRWDRGSGRWVAFEASRGVLVIDAMDAGHAGSYRAFARATPGGEDISPPIAIELLEEPAVVWLLEHEEIEVLAHDVVTLSVRPAGSKPFTYAWFDDQNPVADVRHSSYRPSTSIAGPRVIEAHVSNKTGVTRPTRKVRFLVTPLERREIQDLGIELLPVPGRYVPDGCASRPRAPGDRQRGPDAHRDADALVLDGAHRVDRRPAQHGDGHVGPRRARFGSARQCHFRGGRGFCRGADQARACGGENRFGDALCHSHRGAVGTRCQTRGVEPRRSTACRVGGVGPARGEVRAGEQERVPRTVRQCMGVDFGLVRFAP